MTLVAGPWPNKVPSVVAVIARLVQYARVVVAPEKMVPFDVTSTGPAGKSSFPIVLVNACVLSSPAPVSAVPVPEMSTKVPEPAVIATWAPAEAASTHAARALRLRIESMACLLRELLDEVTESCRRGATCGTLAG